MQKRYKTIFAAVLVIVGSLILLTFRFSKVEIYPSDWKHSLVESIVDPSSLKRCALAKIEGRFFFTPISKIQKNVRECLKLPQLSFKLDKIPPNTLRIEITPTLQIHFIYVNTNLNTYGVVLSQHTNVLIYPLGKPYPEDIGKIYKGLTIVSYDSYPEETPYTEKVIKLSKILQKLPEFQKLQMSVIKNAQTPPTIKIETPYITVLLDADHSIQELESDINKALTVYKYLRKTQQDFEYIDTRFDRITVK